MLELKVDIPGAAQDSNSGHGLGPRWVQGSQWLNANAYDAQHGPWVGIQQPGVDAAAMSTCSFLQALPVLGRRRTGHSSNGAFANHEHMTRLQGDISHETPQPAQVRSPQLLAPTNQQEQLLPYCHGMQSHADCQAPPYPAQAAWFCSITPDSAKTGSSAPASTMDDADDNDDDTGSLYEDWQHGASAITSRSYVQTERMRNGAHMQCDESIDASTADGTDADIEQQPVVKPCKSWRAVSDVAATHGHMIWNSWACWSSSTTQVCQRLR